MFQFDLLTKRDWALEAVTALVALMMAGGLYWLAAGYTNVGISAELPSLKGDR
jgi:hypothetical protein